MANRRTWRWVTYNGCSLDIWGSGKIPVESEYGWDQGLGTIIAVVKRKTFRKIFGVNISKNEPVKVEFSAKITNPTDCTPFSRWTTIGLEKFLEELGPVVTIWSRYARPKSKLIMESPRYDRLDKSFFSRMSFGDMQKVLERNPDAKFQEVWIENNCQAVKYFVAKEYEKLFGFLPIENEPIKVAYSGKIIS